MAAVAVLGALVLWAIYIQVDGVPRYAPIHLTKRVEITPERVLRGRALAGMLCIHCHLDAKQGTLTGKRLPDLPALFGTAYSPNITQHAQDGLGRWTDGELWVLLRTGLTPQGLYTPP